LEKREGKAGGSLNNVFMFYAEKAENRESLGSGKRHKSLRLLLGYRLAPV
jgi:hypothetical protein